MSISESVVHWWGEHPLPGPGSTLLIQLGPFWLAASVMEAACRLVWSTGTDPLGKHLGLSVLGPGDPLPEGPTQELRLPAGGDRVRVTPRLAPRPFICRPIGGVVLPPGGVLDAFVTTPLWMDVGVPDPAIDVPTLRPNETWFGRDTVLGELCFSGRTSLRTQFDHLDLRPHRAVTPVRMTNRRKEPLTVRRLRVPTPSLPLFVDANGAPWTPRVSLTVEGDKDQVEQEVADHPPPEAGPVTRLSPGRVPVAAGLVSRAVNTFLP